MALRRYDLEDEDDFYGQEFDQEGVVSVWIGQSDLTSFPDNMDVLQDLCGVGYHEFDLCESATQGFKLVPVASLLDEYSYSHSFFDAALQAATSRRITNALWTVVQYDFAYNPQRVKRKVEPDPIFIGFFPYSKE